MATPQTLVGPVLLVSGVLLLGAGLSGVWYGTAGPPATQAAVAAQPEGTDRLIDPALEDDAQRLRSAGWVATVIGLLLAVLGALLFGEAVRPRSAPPAAVPPAPAPSSRAR